MVRVCFISDTHSYHRQVRIPECDLLIHAGDLTWKGEPEIIQDYARWIGELKSVGTIRESIVIAGNHDFSFEDVKWAPRMRALIASTGRYLEDRTTEFEGLKIFGAPWSLPFGPWAFGRVEHVLEEYFKNIPDDTDILTVHGPAYGLLDKVKRDGSHVGSKALLKRIKELEKLQVLQVGHIHEAYGQTILGNTKIVNACSCTLQYQPTNKPIVVEL